jgi:HEPN domain-containing protein
MTGTIQNAHARMLFTIAEEDQAVLTLPLPDRIFGFHAQQSCEKMMKALITVHGRTFPFTHYLIELQELLEATCLETIPAVPFPLKALQAYAVQFRYEEPLPLSGPDRTAILATVATLRQHILTRILTLEQIPKP